MKIVECANIIDQNNVHNELPHLDPHILPSIL